MQAKQSKANQGIHSLFPISGGCSAAARSVGLVLGKDSLRRQMPSPWMTPFLFLPQLLQLSMMPHSRGYPFGQPRSRLRAMFLPRLWFTSSWCYPSLARQHEEQKSPGLCVSTALEQLNHQCAIITTYVKNPKHGTIQGSTWKINSIMDKTQAKKLLKRAELLWVQCFCWRCLVGWPENGLKVLGIKKYLGCSQHEPRSKVCAGTSGKNTFRRSAFSVICCSIGFISILLMTCTTKLEGRVKIQFDSQ